MIVTKLRSFLEKFMNYYKGVTFDTLLTLK